MPEKIPRIRGCECHYFGSWGGGYRSWMFRPWEGYCGGSHGGKWGVALHRRVQADPPTHASQTPGLLRTKDQMDYGIEKSERCSLETGPIQPRVRSTLRMAVHWVKRKDGDWG